MVKTLARQVSDMRCEGQRTVEQRAEANCFSGDLDAVAPKRDGQRPKLRQLVQCTKPYELSFVLVSFVRFGGGEVVLRRTRPQMGP